MSSDERALFEKPRVFDAEYTLKFGIMCVIALGIIFLSWTYSFKNNMVIPLNKSNEELFNRGFNNLSILSSQWGNYNITSVAQRESIPKEIDRSSYTFNRGIFGALPLISSDCGKMKYLFDHELHRTELRN